jgi:hypothetical protein
MSVAEIIVDRQALDELVADEGVTPDMYEARADGRFNLRVSADLRRKLDRLVVETGLSHSEVIHRLGLLGQFSADELRRIAAEATL